MSSARALWVLLFLSIAALPACPPELRSFAFGCDDATDCSDGFVCFKGECEPAGAVARPDAGPVQGEGEGEGEGVDGDGGVCPRWFIDNDRDGFGTGAGVVACAQPSGLVDNDDDCNDDDRAIHPGAREIVGDGVDEDCDGKETCFTDADGDGFGSTATEGSTSLSCDGPDISDASDDCDDGDRDVRPGTTCTVPTGNTCTANLTCVAGKCVGPAGSGGRGADVCVLGRCDRCESGCQQSCGPGNFDCTSACRAGSVCDLAAKGINSVTTTCEAAHCEVNALGFDALRASCTNGAACAVQARSATRAEVDCVDSACTEDCLGLGSCDMRCDGGSCALQCSGVHCDVQCTGETPCLLQCPVADLVAGACTLECATVPTTCSGLGVGFVACNQPCPL